MILCQQLERLVLGEKVQPFLEGDLLPKATGSIPGAFSLEEAGAVPFPVLSSPGTLAPVCRCRASRAQEPGESVLGTLRLPAPLLHPRPGPCKEAGSKGHCTDLYCVLTTPRPAP